MTTPANRVSEVLAKLVWKCRWKEFRVREEDDDEEEDGGSDDDAEDGYTEDDDGDETG